MKFKIKNTDVEVSFTFFSIFILFLIKDTRHILLISLLSSLIHEIVHIFFILLFKSKIDKVSLTLFGGNIIRNNQASSLIREAIIHISAPVFNIIFGTFIFLINKESPWGYVNIFLGIFNIIPFYNFDGGNALSDIVSFFIGKMRAEGIVTITSCIIVLLFTALNLHYSIKYDINVSFILINIYFISVFIYKLFKKMTCYV